MGIGSHGGVLQELVKLSHELGASGHKWAILGEGNSSARVDHERFLVKASGSSLGSACEEDFVEIRFEDVEHLTTPDERYTGGKRPSTEASMHAACLEVGAARVVGHTHPISVNQLLCSDQAEWLVKAPLFPDQIVVCGLRPILLPYTDPGPELGRVVRLALSRHREQYGESPRVIYLQNHGMVALGQSTAEVVQITKMATKAAEILVGSLAVGGVVPMDAVQAQRIASREDERYRRKVLGLSTDGS